MPPPLLFACERPDFEPIFNRLLPKCVCLRVSAPDPAGVLATPQTPSWKSVGHILRSADSENEPPLSKSWLRAWKTTAHMDGTDQI